VLVDRWLVPLVGEGAGRALAVGLALVGLLQLLVLLLTGSRLFTANGRLA
jgi:hypothetical protein